MLSPGIIKKVVYSGTHSPSFTLAEGNLEHVGDVKIGAKQIERVCHRVGGELLEQSREAMAAYQALPLVKKDDSPIPHPPAVAVVQMDGGRYQRRGDAPADDADDDLSMEEEPQQTEKGTHWREDKVGLLATMSSEVHEQDPHPEIPEVFVDRQAVEKLAREVGHVSVGAKAAGPGDEGSPSEPAHGLADPTPQPGLEYEPPKPLVRTTVATNKPINWFAKMLAQAAWARGFAKAARKAFIADGASANWNTWRIFFSDYTPILDFIHALSYVFLAAHAVQRVPQAAWDTYCRWIQWIWSGKVTDVIAELEQHQCELGIPEPDEAQTTPRSQLAKALGYLRNHQSQMHYNQYRKNGLPLTSCHVESTVKLFNRRIKGTEKFWSADGAEALLALKAAYLDEIGTMDAYWQKRFSAQTPPIAYAVAA